MVQSYKTNGISPKEDETTTIPKMRSDPNLYHQGYGSESMWVGVDIYLVY